MSKEQDVNVQVNAFVQQDTSPISIPNPAKRFSIGWFIFWLLVFWPACIIQLVMYFTKPSFIRIR